MCFFHIQRAAAPCSRVSPRLWAQRDPQGQSKVGLCGAGGKCHDLHLPTGHRGQAGEGEDAPEGWAVVVFLATPGFLSRGGGWSQSEGRASTGRSQTSLDGCSSHSAMHRGRRTQPGNQGGELISWVELEPGKESGKDPLEDRGGASTPPPAMLLCHSPITSTPFLFPEKCPHFTDRKTET